MNLQCDDESTELELQMHKTSHPGVQCVSEMQPQQHWGNWTELEWVNESQQL